MRMWCSSGHLTNGRLRPEMALRSQLGCCWGGCLGQEAAVLLGGCVPSSHAGAQSRQPRGLALAQASGAEETELEGTGWAGSLGRGPYGTHPIATRTSAILGTLPCLVLCLVPTNWGLVLMALRRELPARSLAIIPPLRWARPHGMPGPWPGGLASCEQAVLAYATP